MKPLSRLGDTACDRIDKGILYFDGDFYKSPFKGWFSIFASIQISRAIRNMSVARLKICGLFRNTGISMWDS